MNKFVVYPGNNSLIIKQALLARNNWEEVTFYNRLNQMINHCSKPILYGNLLIFLFEQTSNHQNYAVLQELVRVNNFQVKMPYQVLINHFQNNRLITTKTGIIRSLKHYYNHYDSAIKNHYTVFNTMPTSFILTVGYEDRQYNDFQRRFNQLQKQIFYKEKVPMKHCQQNLWILKPANSNQGKGITMIKSVKDIHTEFAVKAQNSLWVIQKYIQKPLLYKGRKFDIRVWVLFNQRRQLYMYNKGYIRTSSSEYSINSSSVQIHLTNNSLQKNTNSYSKYQPGNTLPLQCLDQIFNQNYPQLKIGEFVISRMKDIIIDSIMASGKNIAFMKRKFQFELFGYDFMIDEDFRVWLIQVNTNPYLGIPNDYIKQLLPVLIDNMLQLTIDLVFPSKFQKGNNNFQLLFNQTVNNRAPFTTSLYPSQELAPPPNRPNNLGEQQPTKRPQPSPFQSIKYLLQNYPFTDYDPYLQHLNRLFIKIQNWQLQGESRVLKQIAIFRNIAESRVSGLLLQQRYINKIVKILQSKNYPQQIEFNILQPIYVLLKVLNNKKKFLSTDIMNVIIRLILQMHLLTPKISDLFLKIVILIAQSFDRKKFIPGETRDADFVRTAFIEKGGIAIIIIKQKQFKESKEILDRLDLNDWQLLNKQQPHYLITDYGQIKKECEQRIEQLQLQKKLQKKYQQQKRLREKKQIEEQRQQKNKRALQKKVKAQQYIRKKSQLRKLQKQQEDKIRIENRIQQQEKMKKLHNQIQKARDQMKKRPLIKQKPNPKTSDIKEIVRMQEQQKRRIIQGWLQQKKEQSRRKKQQQKRRDQKMAQQAQRRRSQMNKRVQQLKQKSLRRRKQQNIQDHNSSSNQIKMQYQKKQDFVNININNNQMDVHNGYKINFNNKLSLIRQKNQKKKLFPKLHQTPSNKIFKQDKKPASSPNQQKSSHNQENTFDKNVDKELDYFFKGIIKKGEQYQSEIKEKTKQRDKKRRRESMHNPKMIINFIITSPYSGFIKKNPKIKQTLQNIVQMQKNQ